MNPRLERMRDDLRQQIEQIGQQPPIDEVIDTCLYGGLSHLMTSFPATEKVVTVTDDNATQDIATLLAEPMHSILDVLYPWSDDDIYRRQGWPYINIGWGIVMFRGVTPQAGDKMRVRFRPLYAIGELRGAATDTLPAMYEPAILTAATAQYLRHCALKPGADKRFAEMSVTYDDRAQAEIYAFQPVASNPAWTGIGL